MISSTVQGPGLSTAGPLSSATPGPWLSAHVFPKHPANTLARLNLPPLLYWAPPPCLLSPYFRSSHLPGPKCRNLEIRFSLLFPLTHHIPVVTKLALSQENPAITIHVVHVQSCISLPPIANLTTPPFNSHSFSSCPEGYSPQSLDTWRSNAPDCPSLLSCHSPHT